jgi:hypothetical protein
MRGRQSGSERGGISTGEGADVCRVEGNGLGEIYCLGYYHVKQAYFVC